MIGDDVEHSGLMTHRSLLLGALSVTMPLLTAACSGSLPSGPLGDGGPPAVWCAPGTKGVPITMGVFWLENRSPCTVTIESFSLPTLVRLRPTRAYLVPITHTPGHYQVIGEASWPPTARVWAQRHPIVGGVMKPGQSLNLVFGLTMISNRGGYSSGPTLTYTADGGSYTIEEQTALTVGGDGACKLPPGVT
jgi:hypothetical protein